MRLRWLNNFYIIILFSKKVKNSSLNQLWELFNIIKLYKNVRVISNAAFMDVIVAIYHYWKEENLEYLILSWQKEIRQLYYIK